MPGNRGIHLLGRDVPRGYELALLTLWDSRDSIRRFAGDPIDRAFYDDFIAGVCRAHLQSPQIVAFLYAIAPPAAAENLRRNLFEEIGSADAPGHPDLLRRLASAAGFDQARVERIERAAQEDTRRAIGAPIRLPSLRELGFSIMLEVIAFEWMLAQLAGRMGDALARHRGQRITAGLREWRVAGKTGLW